MKTRIKGGWGRLAAAAGVVLAGSWLTGCGGIKSRVHDGLVETTIDQRPDRRDYVEAIGIGASDPSVATDTQRKALSRDAAIVKAQYELLSMIKGVRLEGGVTVSRALEKDSILSARVNDAIMGAEILKSEFTKDNGCVVTMRIPKARLERMQNLITVRSDVFEILVTVQAGYGVDVNGDGIINYREQGVDDPEFVVTAERTARTIYER